MKHGGNRSNRNAETKKETKKEANGKKKGREKEKLANPAKSFSISLV